MVVSFIFQICSLFYILLIMITFFSKERFKSRENRIYIFLMIFDFIILIVDVISVFLIYKLPSTNYFNLFFAKLFLICLIFWEFLITSYVYTISNNDDERKNEIEKVNAVRYWPMLPISILIYLLPLNLKHGEDFAYSEGPAAMLTYAVTAILMVIWIVRLLKRLEYVKSKKCIPIIFYIIFMFIGAGIQFNFPQLLVVSSVSTFVTILMYFTIENPDMKMIEQINKARDAADKANQAKSEFLSSMSHEIRTPLNAIVGFSQVLQDDETLPESAKEEVKDIIMASNGLLEIVNGILDISKIESGKIEIVNQDYDFKEIFDSLVLLTKARMGDKKLDFRYIYDDSIPAVLYGDHTRVKQVILNILTNAIKYTREGFVEFRVSSFIKDDICRLIISVEDSGIGIKEENIDKLFSKFERLDLDKNITIEGTGLGMAITKKLLELMNGKIVVQSVYGKGSKFTVSIDQRIVKMEKEAPVEVLDTDKVEEVDVSGKKVLIVDDNKINLKVASKLLEAYKVEISTFERGNQCIESIRSGEKYDLILMDDMMPELSGVDTLHKIKEEFSDFSTPIIALTANAISGMKEKYLSEGFDDYLAKPIDKGELKKIIYKYLGK